MLAALDLDDFDAAIAELDARYLAGEASAHADTWSVIAGAHAGFNRQELPATTPDPVYIDHRPLVSIEGVDLAASLRAVWDITPASSVYIEAVHRLDELGAVATQVLKGTSQQGLDAEWRMIDIFAVEGDLYSRVEVFDEADLDAALARFDELHSQTRRLENAASQLTERFLAHFAARDWAAIAETMADDIVTDDRRRVVNAGVIHGRDVEIASLRATADVGVTKFTSTVIAIRGGRLALGCYSVLDGWGGSKVLCVSEINADNRIAARVAFDLDAVDAAFEELDARYLAGEAAAHAQTWSVIARECAAFNRHELPAADWVTIDHRLLVTADTSDMPALIRAVWDLTPDLSTHVEAVHRLSSFGAVITRTARGTSQEGFDAEWRMIQVLTVESDRINRLEMFDETDLDAALARFEELQPQVRRLENAASQVVQRFWTYFEARDWDAMAEAITDDFCTHDRRRVVNAGVLRGRAVHITNMRAVAQVGFEGLTSTVIATRGHRHALIRIRSSVQGSPPGEVTAEMLSIVDIDAGNRLTAAVLFDFDDIDAAFEELDARYVAGEAAAHSHTWSVIARECAGFNRHELPAADWVTIDHRSLITIDANDLLANIRASWDLMPDLSIHIEAVHRLSGFGAVVTYTAHGTSQDGFAAEWRMIQLLSVEGDRINRCEIFDEKDIDAALARFDELHPQARRLENAASQVDQRFWTHFAARDWDAMVDLLADDISTEDRRRVVNAGVRHGRDDHIAEMRAVAEVGAENIASTVMATRGARLALTRICGSNRGIGAGEIRAEVLNIVEIDADNRILARVGFDVDDIDAGLEELDARFLAGEAATHAQTWSAVMRAYTELNRGELPTTTRISRTSTIGERQRWRPVT